MKATAVLLIIVLISQPFSTPAQTSNEKKIKDQVVMIPIASIIEVELLQKGSSKIKGKLVSVTDEGFEVQSVKSGTVSSEKVAFADVKSVKEKRGMTTTKKVLIVAVGVLVVAYFIVLATTPVASR